MAPRAALTLLAGLALIGGLAPSAAAQPAATTQATQPAVRRGVTPPATLRTAATLTPAQKEQIRSFVKAEVEAMAAGDPAVLTAARRNLVISSNVLKAGKPTPASPAYQQEYATALADALMVQFKHSDARVRLNAAVTLANITPHMNPGTTLKQPAVAAVQDSSEPVVMWGIRAARDIYPALVDANKAQAAELASAVIAAYRRFPARTPIAEDVFATLTGSTARAPTLVSPAGLGAMIDLLQARADAYANAIPGMFPEEDPAFPARPELDPPVITYLAISGWKHMNETQKAAAGRAIYDQADQLVRLAPLLPRKQAGDTGPRLDDLIKELRYITIALKVLGDSAAAPDVTASAVALNKLCTTTPAQPLMTTELANLNAAMAANNLLGPKPEPPAAAAPPGAPTTPPAGLRPAATRPGATRPVAPRPAATPPAATPPAATPPAATPPAATPPGATRPVAPRPAATPPGVTRPVTPRPAATPPGATRPVAPRPAATPPAGSRPPATGPAAPRPAAPRPAAPPPAAPAAR